MIRPLLESSRKRTKPRTVDLYEVFCAVLYLLKSGGQWRMLASEFPKWRTVHSFRTLPNGASPTRTASASWSGPLKNQVGAARRRLGREPETTFLIVDAQSVKNTESARHKGYDAGKKVSGIKRHLTVDVLGLPHAVAVTTADITDRQGALQALQRCASNLKRLRGVRADAGDTGRPFADAVRQQTGAAVEIAKRRELHKFAVIPKRWIVERSFAWLAGEVPQVVEELRATPEYQSSVHPPGLPRADPAKIVNRFSGSGAS